MKLPASSPQARSSSTSCCKSASCPQAFLTKAVLSCPSSASAAWYEHFAEHMELAPAEFAMSYMMRSGRIDIERLRKLSPRFVEQYERERGA